MNTRRLYLNPNFFVFFKSGEICLWEYDSNGNFIVQKEYIDRIMEVAQGNADGGHPLDNELIDGKIFLTSEPPPRQWGWGEVSRIFHFATNNAVGRVDRLRHGTFSEHYLDLSYDTYQHVDQPELRTTRGGTIVPLPLADTELLKQVSFWEAALRRKTTRHFLRKPLDLQSLASTLYAAFGEVHGPWTNLEEEGFRILSVRKSSPSGGGLHPHDAYVLALNVEGLPNGGYFYQCDQHHLVRISDLDPMPLVPDLVCDQDFASECGALVCITTKFDRIWQKYRHSRAYRTALLDIGHLSQTFHLAVATQSLCSWLTAAFEDAKLSEYLKLSYTEAPMFVLGIGHGTGDYLHPSFRDALKKKRARMNWFSEDV